MKIDYLSVLRLLYQEFIIQKVNLLIETYVEWNKNNLSNI